MMNFKSREDLPDNLEKTKILFQIFFFAFILGYCRNLIIERRLRALVAEDLRWKGHIGTIINKVNRILGEFLEKISYVGTHVFGKTLCFLCKTTPRVCFTGLTSVFGVR